ncbi:MAG: PocR ligand-binding domain-containing protein [Clostridia bacterium]|nr:PocR ligand-binding domain-containing protein [Clostridia bacterium]
MLQFDRAQLEEVMKSFYILSGIRFVLFDAEFHEIISYPKEDCWFCKQMKSCPKTRRKCRYADRRAAQKCEKQNALCIYKCHAGLVEAVTPLHENGKIIGYLMFGQITDVSDKSDLYNNIDKWTTTYGLDSDDLKCAIDVIGYKSSDEITAAAKIMEVCTSYIILKELIVPESNRLFEAAKTHIENHLSEDISPEQLCGVLGVGRTRLYDIFKSEANMGVSRYILRRRMQTARKLLKTTDRRVSQIARDVGFADYNYFSRVYKKTYGKAPKQYRK